MPSPTTPSRGPFLRMLTRPEWLSLLAAVAIAAYFSLRTSGFDSAAGIADVLNAASMLGIAAVAVGLLLIGGGFDLSVGALTVTTALVPALLVEQLGVNIWEALGWSLLTAVVVGLVNGLLVILTRVPSFMVTLGTLVTLQGLNVAATRHLVGRLDVGGVEQAPGFRSAHDVFASTVTIRGASFHASVAWWLGVTLLVTLILTGTKFGNWTLALGNAPASARAAGAPVWQTRLVLHLGTAVAAWLVGTIAILQTTTVSADQGAGRQFIYLIAAVIGGCLLTGGLGSAIGASLGALIYAMVSQGMAMAGWNADWFRVVIGGLLLLAVLLHTLAHRG